MLSINSRRFFQKFIFIMVLAGVAFWAQAPTAKAIGVKTIGAEALPLGLVEMAQAGPSLAPFDLALLNGPASGYTSAVDAALGSGATAAAQDLFLTKLANLIAGLARQGATPQGTLDCHHMTLLMTLLVNRANGAQTASAISALAASVATAAPCGNEPSDPEPEPESEPCSAATNFSSGSRIAFFLVASNQSCLT